MPKAAATAAPEPAAPKRPRRPSWRTLMRRDPAEERERGDVAIVLYDPCGYPLLIAPVTNPKATLSTANMLAALARLEGFYAPELPPHGMTTELRIVKLETGLPLPKAKGGGR